MKDLRAYQVMVQFLEDRYEHSPSDVLGGLLSDLMLLPDGTPADPAVTSDWDRAVRRNDIQVDDVTGVVPMRRAG